MGQWVVSPMWRHTTMTATASRRTQSPNMPSMATQQVESIAALHIAINDVSPPRTTASEEGHLGSPDRVKGEMRHGPDGGRCRQAKWGCPSIQGPM
jgi:hypothetical protein